MFWKLSIITLDLLGFRNLASLTNLQGLTDLVSLICIKTTFGVFLISDLLGFRNLASQPNLQGLKNLPYIHK